MSTKLVAAILVAGFGSLSTACVDSAGESEGREASAVGESHQPFSLVYHQQVTQTALAGEFSKGALTQVVQGNLSNDFAFAYDASYHVDNCGWTEAQSTLSALQDGVLSALGARDEKRARLQFGQMLHIVQDFYAHSNWVEHHHGVDPASMPLVVLIEDAPPSDWSWFSGTYIDTNPTASNCPAGTPSHDDFNKDTPDSPEGSQSFGVGGTTNFDAALEVAARTTKEELRRIEVVINDSVCGSGKTCKKGEKAVERFRGF